MTPLQLKEHDDRFNEAVAITKPEIMIHGRNLSTSGADRQTRDKLLHAIGLFNQVLELNPENWPAMWFVGKIYQRFGDQSAALTWFVRAYEVNPSQVDVAREASLCAMSLGRSEEAISYARSALESQPTNGGLRANLALALLLAGRLDEAKLAIDKATAGGAADTISQTVGSMIDHFIAIGQTPPTTTPALEDYWKTRPI